MTFDEIIDKLRIVINQHIKGSVFEDIRLDEDDEDDEDDYSMDDDYCDQLDKITTPGDLKRFIEKLQIEGIITPAFAKTIEKVDPSSLPEIGLNSDTVKCNNLDSTSLQEIGLNPDFIECNKLDSTSLPIPVVSSNKFFYSSFLGKKAAQKDPVDNPGCNSMIPPHLVVASEKRSGEKGLECGSYGNNYNQGIFLSPKANRSAIPVPFKITRGFSDAEESTTQPNPAAKTPQRRKDLVYDGADISTSDFTGWNKGTTSLLEKKKARQALSPKWECANDLGDMKFKF